MVLSTNSPPDLEPKPLRVPWRQNFNELAAEIWYPIPELLRLPLVLNDTLASRPSPLPSTGTIQDRDSDPGNDGKKKAQPATVGPSVVLANRAISVRPRGRRSVRT